MAIAAVLLSFSGYALWRTTATEPGWVRWQRAWSSLVGDGAAPRLREVGVAWRCVSVDAGDACNALNETERCTTCHLGTSDPRGTPDAPRVLQQHPHRQTLIDRHAELGCVACHGGDGLAIERRPAHEGLVPLSRGGIPLVESRCGICHADTCGESLSPARGAWAQWLATRDGKPAVEPTAKPLSPPDLANSLTKGRSLFQSLRCGACHLARDESPNATPLDVLGIRSTFSQLTTTLAHHATLSATTHNGVDLALDEPAARAVATRLRTIAAPDAATAMLHRASVPGSSAEDGRILETGLACAACHDALGFDVKPLLARTPDWVAYFLLDPARANPAAKMPSLRLSTREAASLARYLTSPSHDEPSAVGDVPCLVNGAKKTMAIDACGEAIISASKCVACHATGLVRSAPGLLSYGEEHDGATAEAKVASHVGYKLDAPTARSLAVYLASQTGTRVRGDLHAPAHDGEALFAALGCGGCHGHDDVAPPSFMPTLFGEGLRVRPQWLFDFLRAPERRPVRPPFHPEWAYRDLVPAEHVTPRMPTFALADDQVTTLVRFFTERDGASFPYAASPAVVLTGEALTTAIGDLTRKDRGACTSCHTIAIPDVARARDSGDKLAPPLALAHERLRAEWIEACIMQPERWVPQMRPFARPVAEVEGVRDLLLLLRDRTVLPAPGAEGAVPALGLGDVP